MRWRSLWFPLLLLLPALLFWHPGGRLTNEAAVAFPDWGAAGCDSPVELREGQGNFQAELNAWARQNFGFRNDLLRVRNQKDFTLFDQAHAKDVVVGKGNYLFEGGYIRAYTGQNYRGRAHFDELGKRLGQVRNLLQRQGTELIAVLAAGKATFYPEYFPESTPPRVDSLTNEYALKAALARNRIPILDLNAWFESLKGTTDYPLMPKLGIHWSKYGQHLVKDTLTAHLESRFGIDLPDHVVDSITLIREDHSTENDLIKAMNVVWYPERPAMARVHTHLDTTNKDALRVLVIGDSYYWDIYRDGFSDNVLDGGDFWYYFREVYRGGRKVAEIPDLDLARALAGYDAVLLWYTETNLAHFGNGFDYEARRALARPPAAAPDSAHVEAIVARIRRTPNWLAYAKQKAAKTGRDLNEVLRSEARYYLQSH